MQLVILWFFAVATVNIFSSVDQVTDASHVAQDLCNGRASVRPSVPIDSSNGGCRLLLRLQQILIDRCGRHAAGPGAAHQQMRVASCCEPTEESPLAVFAVWIEERHCLFMEDDIQKHTTVSIMNLIIMVITMNSGKYSVRVWCINPASIAISLGIGVASSSAIFHILILYRRLTDQL